jgi:hypothetical protein
MVVQVLFLQVATHNFKGVLGPLVLSLHGGWAQLVVPHLLVLRTLDRKGSAGELFGEEPVFELNGAILALVVAVVPMGMAPGRASLERPLPKPLRYLRAV